METIVETIEDWDFSLEKVVHVTNNYLENGPWCDGQGGCEGNSSCHYAPDEPND